MSWRSWIAGLGTDIHHPLVFPVVALICIIAYILYLVTFPLQQVIADATLEHIHFMDQQQNIVANQKTIIENQKAIMENQQRFWIQMRMLESFGNNKVEKP